MLQAAGYTGKVKIGMDVAASEFLCEDGKYDLNFKTKDNDGSQKLTGCAVVNFGIGSTDDHSHLFGGKPYA